MHFVGKLPRANKLRRPWAAPESSDTGTESAVTAVTVSWALASPYSVWTTDCMAPESSQITFRSFFASEGQVAPTSLGAGYPFWLHSEQPVKSWLATVAGVTPSGRLFRVTVILDLTAFGDALAGSSSSLLVSGSVGSASPLPAGPPPPLTTPPIVSCAVLEVLVLEVEVVELLVPVMLLLI